MTTHNELFNRTRAAFQQCFPLLSVTPEQIGTFIQCQMDSGVLPPSKVAHDCALRRRLNKIDTNATV